MLGLLSVLENLGQFDNVAGSGIVSRATIHRYKKEKREANTEFLLDFKNNLPKNLQNRLINANLCGINFLFQN
jgi:hypothetical protein